MKRLTIKTKTSYSVEDSIAAIDRLGRLEDMYDSISAELEKIIVDMAKLSAQDKTKSATYRQLFANKLMLINIKSRFEIYFDV